MRSFLFFAVIVPIIYCNNLPAQSLRETEFTHYTRVEGLSNNFISGILQDSTGYIWVGTNRGLNRFDGRFFANYFTGSAELPLPDNMIKQMRIQGQEIIGTTIMGSFAYNTNSRKGIVLIVPSDSLIFGWTNNIVETIRDCRGHYVLSSNTGLYVFDSHGKILNRYDYFKPSDARSKELIFGYGLSALDNGLILQDNDIFFSAYDPIKNRIDTFYSAGNREFKKAITDGTGEHRTTFPGRKNQLFIVNDKKNALDIFDFDSKVIFSIPLTFEVSTDLDNANSKLFYLNDSLLAITCAVSGFYLFDYHSASHQLSLHGGKYFDGRHCTSIFLDREKRFWVGTNNGLYKQNLTNPFYHAYDLADQLPDLRNCDIRAILIRGNKLFVGFRNRGGLIILDKFSHKIEHRFDLAKSDPDCNTISFIFPYGGDTLWIATSGGILWLNTRNGHYGPLIFPAELSWANGIFSAFIMEDLQRNIWISLRKSNTVIRFNRNTRSFTDISGPQSPLLKITYCFTMGMDMQGNVWFAGDGLCRWNVAKQRIDTLISYSISTKILSSYIFILGLDKNNNLWIYSFNNGIIQYNCTENKTYLRKGESNFWDGDILTASPVIQDHIWLGMDNGISVFNTRDYSSQLFTYADGLPSMPITSVRKGSCYDSAQNIFYFGSGHQLIGFKPDLSFSHPSPPDLFIDEINTPAGIFRGNTENLTLSSSDNSVQIDFNAVNFRSPEDNRFAYRVNPSPDTSWQILNWQHVVNFSNLSPGEYHIQLKLFSANNRWPEQVKQLTITVKPPYWKSIWFIAILVLTVISAILFLYRFRIRQISEKMNLNQLVAEYEMKALHAQMNPHFIFNALNSIKEMILYEDTKNASRYLSRFAQLIRLNLEYSMKTFITLKQNIEYLERYLEMEQLRFADFSFHFTIRGALNADDIRIAPMMLQPLVENAIWHGLLPSDRDKRLDISFYLDENNLVCEIEDNGIGIQKSMDLKNGLQVMHESVGIENIRQRIVILNEKYHIQCTLSIVDKKDIPGSDQTGTLAKLVIPQFDDALITHS
jgi:two-component sensor histidine kinase